MRSLLWRYRRWRLLRAWRRAYEVLWSADLDENEVIDLAGLLERRKK